MSLYKNKSGEWGVRFRAGGKHRSKLIGAKADAVAYDDERRRRKRLGGVELGASEENFGDFVEDWWRTHRTGLAPNTRESYSLTVDKHILPFFEGYRICDIGVDAIEDFKVWMDGRGTGKPTQHKVLSVLSTIFSKAIRGRRLMFNPVSVVSKPTPKRAHKVRAFPPERVEAMRANLTLEEATFVSVVAYAGPRPPSEPLSLTWADVDEANIYFTGDKTGRPRAVPLLAPLRQDLEAWHKASGVMVGRVFDWTPGRYRTFREKLRRDHDLPRLYDLRHAYATLMLQQGEPLGLIARWLGHSPSVCEDTYSHLEHLAARRVDAVSAIEAARTENLQIERKGAK